MLRGRRKASEFSAEIEAHIQLEIDLLREQGLSEQEARAAARCAFGNVSQGALLRIGSLVVVGPPPPGRSLRLADAGQESRLYRCRRAYVGARHWR